jgi:N-acetylglutamate synthase-like GNAT family acetyltransferase/DNA-binding MarR family transcriptional regulator
MTNQIEILRYVSRKLVRELGMLELDGQSSSPINWHALIEISKEPGIKILKLGQLLLLSDSRVSRLVKSLKKSGFVELKNGLDKREKDLYLTEAGKNEIKKIDSFSKEKIIGAFEFIEENELIGIINSLEKYSAALEKNRKIKEQVKIATISTSRVIRKQIVNMVTKIQRDEFFIPVTDEMNLCILKAEKDFYYHNSYNFWYAIDDAGKVIGSIGLKKINSKNAEIKKFFVIPKYRRRGVAQRLMKVLLKAAQKNNFEYLFLGTVDKLKAACKFYTNHGFENIKKEKLPPKFEICYLDNLFFKGAVKDLR